MQAVRTDYSLSYNIHGVSHRSKCVTNVPLIVSRLMGCIGGTWSDLTFFSQLHMDLWICRVSNETVPNIYSKKAADL